MSASSLFSRLSIYSQNPKKPAIENFTTEVLAYLINEDHTFRRIFVRHLIRDKRLARSFLKSKAKTQQPYPRGIVDLVLSNSDKRKILVEVKIGSSETMTEFEDGHREPQIEKYLRYRAGHVAYLTTRRVPAPDIGAHAQFLGQCYFEDLYAQLDRQKNRSPVCELFMDFMEEQNMAPPEPLTPKEVHSARMAFLFAKKGVAVLDKVRTAVTPEFRRLFNGKTSFTNVRFHPKWLCVNFRATQFHRGAVKHVDFGLDTYSGKLGLYLNIYTRKHSLANELHERLCRRPHWESDRRSVWCYVYHLKGDGKDIECMIRNTLRELRKLRPVLSNYLKG